MGLNGTGPSGQGKDIHIIKDITDALFPRGSFILYPAVFTVNRFLSFVADNFFYNRYAVGMI